MTRRLLQRFTTSLVALALLAATPAGVVLAQPAPRGVAGDEARLARALERFDAANERRDLLERQVAEATKELDRLVEVQQRIRQRLGARSRAMYRSGDTSFLSVLLGAATFEEFAARWDLLERMNRQDVTDLRALSRARRDAERTARAVSRLQEQRERDADRLAADVAQARKDLAASRAAREKLEAHVRRAEAASSGERRPKAAAPDATQQRRGTGAWKTAVASHYGRNFTGRGASGERIGPYSMIVAHKTLPFGTLIEFEYRGRRAVAHVADRGPHVAGREFDLGPGVVRALDFSGVDTVRYRIIGR